MTAKRLLAMTDLSDENRPTEQRLLRKFAYSTLRVFRRSKLDDTGIRTISLSKTTTFQKPSTHPHPLETPVGVTRTSANRTSPAANPKRKKNSHQYPLDNSTIHQQKNWKNTRALPPHKLTLPVHRKNPPRAQWVGFKRLERA